MRSTSMRFSSSGISRSPLRSPASTCATGTPLSTPERAPASVEFVSPYEDQVGGLTLHGRRNGRLHRGGLGRVQVEAVAGLGDAELVEEDL